MSRSPTEEALDAVRAALSEFESPQFSPPYLFESMPGGASTRKFFRVTSASGKSLVAMYVPKPSQEVEKARQAQNCRPFVEVRDLLESRGVNVPVLYKECADKNVLLVEDLGDLTLAEFLKVAPDAKSSLYTSAVQALARAQNVLEELPEASIIRTRSFDKDLLLWEIHHFLEYALTARGIELDSDETNIFLTAAEMLADRVASLPQGFAHRDYQSRNLMLRSDTAAAFSSMSRADGSRKELTWIDFQDAMLGPRVYDLVALLTDSYQTFSRDFVLDKLAEYAQELGRSEELEQIIFEFDLVTVQRKLKDAGRFVFLDRVNHAAHFLRYVEPTVDKVIDALGRLEDEEPLKRLRDLLVHRLRS
jgi:N-acetylmuramate 1-kinase